MTKDILVDIKERLPTFSKGQKRIGNYILSSYSRAAYMTAHKLGQQVNVSESTVVRFATELGYEGYPSMQKALQEMIRNKLTTLQRLEVSHERIINNEDVLSMVMHADAENIRMTLEGVNKESFDQVVRAILSARKVYIVGIRSASAIAEFLGFYLNMARDNVVVVHINSFSEVFEQIFRIGEGDILLGISFPRYSKRTVKTMRYAKAQGATTVAITDSALSPLAELADHTLQAKSDMISFVDSLVAPLSLVNALITAVSRQRDEELTGTFDKLEQIWDEYEVFEKTDA